MKEKKVLFITPFFDCEECMKVCYMIETGIRSEFNKRQDYSLQVTRSSSVYTLSDEIIATDFCIWVVPAGSIVNSQNFTRDLEKAIGNEEKKMDVRCRGKLSVLFAVHLSNDRPFAIDNSIDLEETKILILKFQNFLMNLGFLLVFLGDYPLQPNYPFQVTEKIGYESNSLPWSEITTNLLVNSNEVAFARGQSLAHFLLENF